MAEEEGGETVNEVFIPSRVGLTVEQARKERRCRVCGEPLGTNAMQPLGWHEDYREMVFPVAIILNFGAEYAHPKCVNQEGQKCLDV